MVASNDQKARLLDLNTSVLKLVQEEKRGVEGVARVLQIIKDRPDFEQVLFPVDKSLESQLQAWQKRFRKTGIRRQWSYPVIPPKPEGLDRLIVVPKELRKPSAVIRILEKKMKVYTFTDLKNLDSRVTDVVNRPEGDYVIWVRDRQEADEELANLSAEMIKEKGLNTETLTERLLHEWAYNEETGQHLDVKNITLCSGSRYANAGGGVGVPGVGWVPSYGGLDVCWCYLDGRNSCLRGRVAVS